MTDTFDAFMSEVMASASRFGHRQHVQLTWLAVRTLDLKSATTLVSEGIMRTARYAGAPQKYHVTMSRAWVELVAYHHAKHPAATFSVFAEQNPGLLDKRLLTRFYSSTVLASAEARSDWLEPDLAPLPGCRP